MQIGHSVSLLLNKRNISQLQALTKRVRAYKAIQEVRNSQNGIFDTPHFPPISHFVIFSAIHFPLCYSLIARLHETLSELKPV